MASKGIDLSDDPQRRGFYLEQRNKHLSQFMAINARAVFTVVGVFVALFFGGEKIKELPLQHCVALVIGVLVALGALALFSGAVAIAKFHTTQIRRFEKKCDSLDPAQTEDFQIIPPEASLREFFAVGVGIALLIAAALVCVISLMLTHGAAASPTP